VRPQQTEKEGTLELEYSEGANAQHPSDVPPSRWLLDHPEDELDSLKDFECCNASRGH
jgi:hypothetical protein